MLCAARTEWASLHPKKLPKKHPMNITNTKLSRNQLSKKEGKKKLSNPITESPKGRAQIFPVGMNDNVFSNFIIKIRLGSETEKPSIQ